MLNLPICNKMDGEKNIRIMLSDTFPKIGCDCLDPCSQEIYKFQVCILKINILKLSFETLQAVENFQTTRISVAVCTFNA